MCKQTEALTRIKEMDKPFITPAEAAEVIGCHPHYIRLMARQNPDALGFKVTTGGKKGHRTYIPRLPFIQYVEGA